MNIYEIQAKLKNYNTPVFTTNDITRISGLKKTSAIVSIKRMIDKQLIFRIAKGYYSISDDPILYATYIVPNSYISFNTALYLHRVIDQIPTTITVAVPKRIKKQVPGVAFIKLPKNGFQGYKSMQYAGYSIWVASIEKAYADIAYKFGQTQKIVDNIHYKKFKKYLDVMKISREIYK